VIFENDATPKGQRNHEHEKGESDESIFQAARIDRLRLAGYMSPRQSERGCSYAGSEIQQ
jgi:hypothetical protein